jgi:hypothetical protein
MFQLDFLGVNRNIGPTRFLIILHWINSPSISFEVWVGLSQGSPETQVNPLGQAKFLNSCFTDAILLV